MNAPIIITIPIYELTRTVSIPLHMMYCLISNVIELFPIRRGHRVWGQHKGVDDDLDCAVMKKLYGMLRRGWDHISMVGQANAGRCEIDGDIGGVSSGPRMEFGCQGFGLPKCVWSKICCEDINGKGVSIQEVRTSRLVSLRWYGLIARMCLLWTVV